MCGPKLVIVSENGFKSGLISHFKSLAIEDCVLICITGKEQDRIEQAVHEYLQQSSSSFPKQKIVTSLDKNIRDCIEYANHYLNEKYGDADVIYI